MLPLPAPGRPIEAVSLGGPALGMDLDIVDADGNDDPPAGRRARVPAAVAVDDPRDLGRSGALPRRVLAPVPRRVGARRLGQPGRRRLLVPARSQRRHTQHRRQADRTAEVESVVGMHASVAECAAVGIPDPVKGESVWVIVVPKPSVDELRGSRGGDPKPRP